MLEARNLTKHYPSFTLDHVSFALHKGEIMGFIGRNGAGKTTTIKSLLGIVHPDEGESLFDGELFQKHELANKQRLSVSLGGIDFYPKTRLGRLTSVTRRFYESWDDDRYQALMERFALDEGKTVRELSQGMKVKYSLAIALSHHAEVLILDEPTSGLDPVSRDEVLEIFEGLVREENVSILFSTHITSDLEHIADTVTYIRQGKILSSKALSSFKSDYLYYDGPADEAFSQARAKALSSRIWKDKGEALFRAADAPADFTDHLASADLDTIMIFLEREGHDEEPLA